MSGRHAQQDSGLDGLSHRADPLRLQPHRELLIAQSMAMLAGNLVVWYAVTVGVYLAAMGIGALLYDRWLQGSRWRSLFQVEIALTVVGALAVPVVHFAHAVHLFLYFNDFDISGSVLFFTVCFLTIFVVGLLTGLELPLLIRLGNDLSPARRVTNRVLGFDYLGALAGGLLFPLVLLPYQELLTIGLVTANANLCVAAFVLYRSSPAAPRRQPVDGLALRAGICAALTGVLVVSYANVGNLQQYFLKKYYYYDVAADSLGHLLKSMPDMPDVFRASSPYQKIDIVQASSGDKTLIDAYSTKYIEDPSQPRDQFLFLNGDFQVGSNYEEVYHEFFAHVPVLLHGTVPDRVLVMGGGDGLLIRELLKYTELDAINHVDLDPVLISLAKTHPTLTGMNGHALEDPRVHTVIGDAYQHIRNHPERYDAIYLDFPYVMDYNLSRLYSREFFHFVREHLTEGGYAVFDAPNSDLFGRDEFRTPFMDPSSDWPVYYETLKAAGFDTIVPFVSALDVDNPAACEALRPLLEPHGLTGDAGVAWTFERISNHVDALMQGFILARRGPSRGPPKYRDLGVKLHVLNETRFQLAFEQPYPMRAGIDVRQVNSIVRPTMPTVAWSYIRTAW